MKIRIEMFHSVQQLTVFRENGCRIHTVILLPLSGRQITSVLFSDLVVQKCYTCISKMKFLGQGFQS